MVTCSIIGATSFTGGELIRILARHPYVQIGHLTSRSEDGMNVRDLVPGLGKANHLKIEKFNFKKVARSSDVVFLTLPHTQAMKVAGDFYDAGKVVIDLSSDFRLKQVRDYEQWYRERHQRKDLVKKAVYGLPEVYRDQIRHTNLIANPGCYPTGAVLGIYPLLREKLIELDSIVIDSKSGVSGAGRKLSPTTQFCEVDENFSAYKVNRHQHAPEIEQVLSEAAHVHIRITFVPHLLPVNRGILSTIYMSRKSKVKKERLVNAVQAFAEAQPFVRFLGHDRFPTLRDVQYTNFCDIGISVDVTSERVIVISAIDNLLKGASGQAVQNMNIRLGFPEEVGLVG